MNPKTEKNPLLPILAIVGVGCFGLFSLICIAIGVVFFLRQDTLTPLIESVGNQPSQTVVEAGRETGKDQPAEVEESQNPVTGFTEISSLHLRADGTLHTDQSGVGLLLPPGVIDEDEQVRLTSSHIDGDLYRELSEVFHIESPVYSLAVVGEGDIAGRVGLSFPAASDLSRALVIIDDHYLGFLDITPENGRLTIPVHAGPTDLDDAIPDQAESGSPSIRYVILSPKKVAGVDRPPSGASDSFAPVGLTTSLENTNPGISNNLFRPPAATYHLNCTFFEGNHVPRKVDCRRNSNDSIQVHWDEKRVEYSAAAADQLIKNMEDGMKLFFDQGFVNAQLISGSPMYIVVYKGPDSYYHPATGVFYLDQVTAKNLAEGKMETTHLHEMAHIIQHKKYRMLKDYYSAERKWWLEISAENMVFLVAPEGVNINLNEYGQAGFQARPFQWNESLYIHAQLLRVKMCPDTSVCPLSIEGFKQAINQGTYPLSDAKAQATLTGDLSDYARYLLGETPKNANPVTLSGIRLGGLAGFGDNLVVRSRNNRFSFEVAGSAPQVVRSTGTGVIPDFVNVNAKIEQGGVYPFAVMNGSSSGIQGHLPASITIYPGVRFWLKVGDEEAVYYDGSQEVIVQPVSEKMGFEDVRMVALGGNQGGTFQALVAVIDLQGDWVIASSNLVSFTDSCQELGIDMSIDPVDLPRDLSLHFASRGVYKPSIAAGSLGYAFEASPGYSLTEQKIMEAGYKPPPEYNINHTGAISMDPDGIEWTMELAFELIPTEASLPGTPVSQSKDGFPTHLAGLFVLVIPASAFFCLSARNPRLRITGLMLALMLVSMACILQSLSYTTRVQLDRIEYLLPYNSPPSEVTDQAIFRLTGAPVTTVINFKIIIPAITEGGEVKSEAQEKNCRLDIVTESVVEIFPDGFITGYDLIAESETVFSDWGDGDWDDDDWDDD
jgi:hypothetical protein